MDDLASRIAKRIQISSDALTAYPEAVDRGFGRKWIMAKMVKTYAVTPSVTRRGRRSV